MLCHVERTERGKYNNLEEIMYTDESVTCIDWNATFTLISGEHELYARKSLRNKSTGPSSRSHLSVLKT
jgi:hypothetical protein